MVRQFKLTHLHKRIVSKKTLFKILSYIDANPDIRTPTLLIDKEKLIENAKLIGKQIPGSRVFYAVKANGDPKILRILKELDIGFEIASIGEFNELKKLGIEPDRIITSNPIKSIEFIEQLYNFGVKYFVFDSPSELEKLEKFAPGCLCYVRLSVPNEGSEWPLSKKFGVELEEGFSLLKRAKEGNIVTPIGITFHVGSQCLNPYNWYIAIDKAKRLFDLCKGSGIELKLLNIGGGYPISYTKVAPKIIEIENHIKKYLKEKFKNNIQIFLEPGRAVIGDCGIMITRVLGTATRGYENWIYLDVGVFNGLMEALGGIKYSYLPEKINKSDKSEKHPQKEDFFERHKKWTIAGPSCDSMDVIEKNVELPIEIRAGQLVLIPSAGAYTTSYASEFNGFPIPEVVII
jgi:ornithine decarboxylase